jgi:hypothetical protein
MRTIPETLHPSLIGIDQRYAVPTATTPSASTRGRLLKLITQQSVIDNGFVVFCLIVATVRFTFLGHTSVLPGIDAGNWLAIGHSWFGASTGGGILAYPPVVPLLTVAFVDLFGPINGVAILAAVASVAPAIGAYLLLRSQRLGWIAAILAGFLVVARTTGEATAWGGYPQLFGLGLAVLTLLAMDRYLRSGRRKHALVAGILLALDLATSHLTGLVTLAAGTVIVALHVVSRSGDSTTRLRQRWRAAWLFFVPSIALLPIYWRLLPALADEIPGPSAPSIRDAAIGGSGPLWIVGVTAIMLTPLLLWRRRRDTLWILTTSLVLVTALTYLFTREPRLLYFGPLAAIFAVATWLDHLGRHSTEWTHVATVAALILTGALAVQTFNSVGLFQAQRDFYDVAPPGTLAATNWLRTATPRDAVIAVTPVGGAPLGWWVEGLTQHPTYTDASLEWLAFPQERTRARAAASIFSDTFPNNASLNLARRLGIRYLFVARTWEGYDPQQMRLFEEQHPNAVAFEDASVAVLRTTGSR